MKCAIWSFALAVAGVVGFRTAAQAAPLPVNQVVLSDIIATNNSNSTSLYKIAVPVGPVPFTAAYVQDAGNKAQYAAGGYAGVPGTVNVVSNYLDSTSASRNNALVMTVSDGPANGALYFDTGPNPLVASNNVTMSFSLDMVQNAGTSDPVTSAGVNGSAFAANIFAEGISATRFIAAPTSDIGGVFGLTKADGSLHAVANYLNGVFYDLDVTLDFTSQLATLSVDGVSGTAIPFRNVINAAAGQNAPRLTEVFFYQNTYAAAVTPLPSAAAAGLVLMSGMGLIRRRRTVAGQ